MNMQGEAAQASTKEIRFPFFLSQKQPKTCLPFRFAGDNFAYDLQANLNLQVCSPGVE